MSWQIALCRFIHRSNADDSPVERQQHNTANDEQARIATMLAALTAALLGFEGRFGLWPPRRLDDLLSMYQRGQQRWGAARAGAVGKEGPLIAQGLQLLDVAVQARCGVRFEALSPTLRLYLVQAMVNGEMAVPASQAQQFIETFVDVVTTAFLGSDDEAFGHLLAHGLSVTRS